MELKGSRVEMYSVRRVKHLFNGKKQSKTKTSRQSTVTETSLGNQLIVPKSVFHQGSRRYNNRKKGQLFVY